MAWRPTENLEFYYRFDKSWQGQDANVLLNMAQPDQVSCFFYNQCAQGVTTPQTGDRFMVLVDGEDPGAYMDTETHIFQTQWDFAAGYTRDEKNSSVVDLLMPELAVEGGPRSADMGSQRRLRRVQGNRRGVAGHSLRRLHARRYARSAACWRRPYPFQ